MPLSPADQLRARGLRRMRLVALSMLGLAAAGFLLTLDRTGWLGFVNAGCEAAMVGALADWFAVTALFRHPLGLPIPHTAIIPNRKEALGQSLQDFVSENFLVSSIVRERVLTAGVSRRVGDWLATGNHADRVVSEASSVVRGGLAVMNDTDIVELTEHLLIPRLNQEALAPAAGHLLGRIVDDGAHHSLVDLVVAEAHRWLLSNRGSVSRAIKTRAPWWTPRWVDDRVTHRLHAEVIAWLEQIRDNPDHPARQAVDEALRKLADDLLSDPQVQARAEALKRRLLAHEQVPQTVLRLWNALRAALVDAISDEDGILRQRGVAAVRELAARLSSDAGLQSRFDGYAADAAVYVIDSFGPEIASVISETVNRWDGKEAARRIELHVGRDLQFIRINGTVVGALVGLVIHTVAVAVT
jgi:uncharacterized membrane-anchored protein YjiN (DUF445 family)